MEVKINTFLRGPQVIDISGKTSNKQVFLGFNPHFSPGICCNSEYTRIYCVALIRTPQRTVRHAFVGLTSRALYLQASSLFRDDTW